MALYSVPDMKRITKIPHDSSNRPIIRRIPSQQLGEIFEELNRLIDEVVDSPNELITAGWIPDSDWRGTVWQPIYEAASTDHARAAMVFGALVFEAIMERPEDWSLGKGFVNGREIGSMTYFRINR